MLLLMLNMLQKQKLDLTYYIASLVVYAPLVRVYYTCLVYVVQVTGNCTVW